MPHRINLKKSMPRHIIFKFMKTKDKEKNLELASEKLHLSYRGKTTCVTANFSSKTMEARKEVFQVLKEKNCPTRILHPTEISFKNEREINTFSCEGKTKTFSSKENLLTTGPL